MRKKTLNEIDLDVIENFAANNMNVSKAARTSFLSRDSFVYHLDKIQDLLGLDPRNFYDLTELLKMKKDGVLL